MPKDLTIKQINDAARKVEAHHKAEMEHAAIDSAQIIETINAKLDALNALGVIDQKTLLKTAAQEKAKLDKTPLGQHMVKDLQPLYNEIDRLPHSGADREAIKGAVARDIQEAAEKLFRQKVEYASPPAMTAQYTPQGLPQKPTTRSV